MKHDCRINYLETSEDDEGYLYLEWKKVFGSNTGKFKIEFCPVCGMKAKKSSIEHMTLYPREDVEKCQFDIMHGHIMDIFKSCCETLVNEKLDKKKLDEHYFQFCVDSIYHTLTYLKARRKE